MLNAEMKVASRKMESFSIHLALQHSALSVARINKGGSNSVVESQPSKLLVAGSIPVSRSIRLGLSASLMAGRHMKSNALSERSESTGEIRRKVVWGS